MNVLLDANGLMVPGQFGVDIFEGIGWLVGSFEPVTLPEVIKELEGISGGRGRDASAARVAISLSKRCSLVRSPVEGVPVDDMIISYAVETGCMVMTNDRGLRERLLDKNIDVISLRNQKTLEILRS